MKDRNHGKQNQQEQSNQRSSQDLGYEQTSSTQNQEQRGSRSQQSQNEQRGSSIQERSQQGGLGRDESVD